MNDKTVGGAVARRVEEALDRVRALEGQPVDASALAELRLLVGHRSAHVAGRAARIAGEQGLTDLREALRTALPRFATQPVKRDPGCVAKHAILEALDLLDEADPDVFEPWVAYRQPEPSWGPPVDSATGVRIRAGRALARLRHHRALDLFADQLADPEPVVRQAAAEAIAWLGVPAGAALLRLKIRVGDSEPEVVEACLAGLFVLTPDAGLALGLELLGSRDRSTRLLAGLSRFLL